MTVTTNLTDPTFDFYGFAAQINIVGVGGIGSHVARLLVKGGLRSHLAVWDGDHVEPHNCRNQTYDPEQVGQLKTDALRHKIRKWGGTDPIQFPHLTKGQRLIPGIVFLCVDRMDTRQEIWQSCVKGNAEVPIFIETRMDGINILIHVVDPCDPTHQHDWERYCSYSDAEAVNETTGCGGPIAVLPSASMTADLAVWQLMRYADIKGGANDVLDNQIRFNIRTLEIKKFRW
ncbi:MAG TPA: ThiF family adenylyltransferase [Candidatus Paceibacterota bacterium]